MADEKKIVEDVESFKEMFARVKKARVRVFKIFTRTSR